MNNFETATVKIENGIPFCAFCEDRMLLAYEGQTPAGYNLQAYICEKCFSTYVQENPNDTYLQFYDILAVAFQKIWRKSNK